MRTRIASPLLGLGVLAALAGCVTINVYFPESAVKDLSERIEDRVRERAEELEKTAPDEKPSLELPPSGLPGPAGDAPRDLAGVPVLKSGFFILQARGSVPAPEVTSPAIRAIIESRAARLADIDAFKGRGVLGEGNDAHLVVRTLDPVSDLRERARVQRLVKDENDNRERLFSEILAVKNVDKSQVPRIRETYAETLRRNARPGDWIQQPSGEWVQARD